MTCYKNIHQKESGFTLLELLIGLALPAILCLILFSTYRMVLSYQDDARTHLAEQEEKRLQIIIIDNDYANLYGLDPQDIPIQLQPFLSFAFPKEINLDMENLPSDYIALGEEHAEEEILLAFTTYHNLFNLSSDPISPLKYVEYIAVDGRLGQHLIRRERDFANLNYYAKHKDMILFRNIQNFSVEILLDGLMLSTWQKEFEEKSVMQAVEITIKNLDNEEIIFYVPLVGR